MATAEVQQVVSAAVHDNNYLLKEDEDDGHVQDMPSTEIEQAPHEKVHSNGESKEAEGKHEEVLTIDADEDQGVAQEVEAKLTVRHEDPAVVEAKEPKEERRGREAKKTEKAASKAAVVPVDDEPDEDVAAPAAAPVAPEGEEAAGEEATNEDDKVLQDNKEDASEKKVHEE